MHGMPRHVVMPYADGGHAFRQEPRGSGMRRPLSMPRRQVKVIQAEAQARGYVAGTVAQAGATNALQSQAFTAEVRYARQQRRHAAPSPLFVW